MLRLPLQWVVALFVCVVLPAGAQINWATYNPPTSGPGVCLGGTTGEFGRIVINVGDSNGNGIPEFAVADPAWTSPTTGASTGAVFVYEGSGNTSTVIRCYQGTTLGGRFGYAMVALPDLNGDGAAEIACLQGSPLAQQSICWRLNSGQGPQTVLFTSPNPAPLGWGVNMAVVSNADTIPGFPENDIALFHTTSMELRSSRSGTVLATAAVASPLGGRANQIAMNDMNGDGFRDLAIGDVFASVVRIFSGGGPIAPFGTLLGTITPAPAPPAQIRYGFALASLGDVNGDGLGDLVIGSPNVVRGSSGFGFAVVATCSPAASAESGPRVFGGAFGSNFGHSVARLAPEAPSTTPDFVVGADNAGTPGAGGSIHVFAVNQQFQKYQLTDPLIPDYGRFVADASDTDGDGINEIVVSAGAPSFPWVRVIRGAGTARTQSVGAGCATAPSTTPTLLASLGNRPVLNTLYTLWYRLGVANAPAVTFLGFRQNPPLPLTPTCLVHVDLVTAVPFNTTTDVIGQSFLPLAIPNDPSIIGTSLTAQTVQVDASANIVLSNAVDIFFGY